MRFLLDTMVVSEPAKPKPNSALLSWLDDQVSIDLGISVITLGEIARGVTRMNEGKRKRLLMTWLMGELPLQFEGRLLPIDHQVAHAWGQLTADADAVGRPLPAIDGLLLATAKVHELTLVTRNIDDFNNRGVEVLNPYR